MSGKWSAAARHANARRRAARRLYARCPLLAVDMMRQLRDKKTGELRFPDYSHYLLVRDVTPRRAPRRRQGRRTAPTTFKQAQLERLRRELALQHQLGEEVNAKMLRAYDMLLRHPSPHVLLPVTFRGKLLVVPVPHTATSQTARQLKGHINALCGTCDSPEELRAAIDAYIKENFPQGCGA